MTWQPDHPGGRIHCDKLGCTTSRRAYDPPAKREGWVSVEVGSIYGSHVNDYCPKHNGKERQP